MKTGILFLAFVLIATPAATARPDRVKPPTFATDDVDERMRECLRVIARHLAPDEKKLQGKIRQAGTETPGVKKRGLNIMVSRWDKGPQYALACLAVGENVAEANAHIIRWCRQYPISKDDPQDAGDVDPRKILRAALLPETRARLTADALAAIEEAAYAFVFKRSVIDPAAPPWNNAGRSVWFMSGSENHDAVQKMGNLLALQFLCVHGKRHNADTKLADGRPAREHYAAWVSYWKEHTRQRAREGIFAEVAQPGSYGRATISGAIAITRAKDSIDQQFGFHWTKNLTYAWGWHNAPDEKILEGESQIFTTHYRPPAIVTAIARGLRLPPYLASMRCPGLGGDKTNDVNEALFADGEARNSHLRRTSWVTPEYMLSGLASDPARHYLAISTQSRIAGITFSSGVHDRITIIGYDKADAKSISYNAINTLPWRDCLIAGRDPSGKTVATRIYVSHSIWTNRVEAASGWLFLRAGGGFCALRVVSGGYKVGDAHHKMGVHLTLDDKDSPMIFQTGRAMDFAAFQEAVATKARIEFANNCLRYRSLAGDDLSFWVKEPRVPQVNGETFPLNPPETYSSPYLTMKHGTDIARIRFPGFKERVLDFHY
ncbi:MAG: hypothetical protein NTY01_21260 [Verrucomicrobia bacterium]|nr:hypothetical protein [Verrucomicrobiota bacterium]